MNRVVAVPRSAAPLYLQVRDQIRTSIEEGVWKPGDLLPTEIELSERFEVSPGTVKQAILALVQDGLLTRRSGKGTFVKRLDVGKSLARFFRFHDSASLAHLGPEVRLLDKRVMKCPSPEIAKKLGISRAAKVLYLRRAMFQDKKPICLYKSYLPYEQVKELDGKNLDGRTVYEFLEQELGIFAVRAEEFLTAAAAKVDDARFLGVRKGAPVICIERTVYSYEDKVIEFRKIIGRGDKFQYEIEVR
jgi:GntR family transcriptional regulator